MGELKAKVASLNTAFEDDSGKGTPTASARLTAGTTLTLTTARGVLG
jgi:hypothetical protein